MEPILLQVVAPILQPPSSQPITSTTAQQTTVQQTTVQQTTPLRIITPTPQISVPKMYYIQKIGSTFIKHSTMDQQIPIIILHSIISTLIGWFSTDKTTQHP